MRWHTGEREESWHSKGQPKANRKSTHIAHSHCAIATKSEHRGLGLLLLEQVAAHADGVVGSGTTENLQLSVSVDFDGKLGCSSEADATGAGALDLQACQNDGAPHCIEL